MWFWALIHARFLSFIFVHFRSFSSTLVHSRPLSLMPVLAGLGSSALGCARPHSASPVRARPCSSALVFAPRPGDVPPLLGGNPQAVHPGKPGAGRALFVGLIMGSRRIFVGGLSQSVTEGAFRDYFSQYGPVVDATVRRRRLEP